MKVLNFIMWMAIFALLIVLLIWVAGYFDWNSWWEFFSFKPAVPT